MAHRLEQGSPGADCDDHQDVVQPGERMHYASHEIPASTMTRMGHCHRGNQGEGNHRSASQQASP